MQPDEYQLYLFNEGTNYYTHKFLGCHKAENGYSFSLWAPNAKVVSLVGDFNSWDINANQMQFNAKFGVWTCESDRATKGDLYKFYITGADGKSSYKADPYATRSELRPGTASQVWDADGYEWNDNEYLTEPKKIYETAKVIYELHVGSWRCHPDGSFYTYRELAEELPDYLKDMGFTHLELMPIAEYPYDGSWGYQITGYYSVTSRYGTPEDFKYFIDKCHNAGLGVILDWVPAHFPKDDFGLAMFDGTALYEYEDKRLGEHLEWGTKVFNFKRAEVVSFLISNAMYWLEEYHIDGLRVDAVSSMLYLDYNREKEFVKNKFGGNHNLEAVAFLQQLNKVVFSKFPEAMMIAEESTAWPMVTKPIDIGGLGFNFKWNMGWMNDTLDYMSLDPIHRKANHDKLTFSMHYAFSENYVLALSHDEVVHGKKSILDKMSGEYNEKFANLRAYYAYMMAHPGMKLFFMGDELGHFTEWAYDRQLDWNLLDYPAHSDFKSYFNSLIHTYRKENALWEIDNDWSGFEWLRVGDKDNSVIAFARKNKKSEEIICAFNFTPIERLNYALGVNKKGFYDEILNTDMNYFGGSSQNIKEYATKMAECDGKNNTLYLDLPPLSAVYLKKRKPTRFNKVTGEVVVSLEGILVSNEDITANFTNSGVTA